jgi:hypothetical protein
MSKRKQNVLLGVGTLLLGTILYILFRKTTYVSIIFQNIRWVNSISNSLECIDNDFLKYYLPDFLWALSLCCGFQVIYTPGIKGNVICGVIAVVFGGVWEILQHAKIVSGTGDFVDVLMYLLAGTICVILNLKERDK